MTPVAFLIINASHCLPINPMVKIKPVTDPLQDLHPSHATSIGGGPVAVTIPVGTYESQVKAVLAVGPAEGEHGPAHVIIAGHNIGTGPAPLGHNS